tara:strand:+ start:3988 stop:5373 length:1386 start_codon:yes stop_codon:yes gene_type:complete
MNKEKIKFSLKAISSIDGRYSSQTEILSNYFSEFALIKKKVFVEIHYLIKLIEILKKSNKSLQKYSNNKIIQNLYEIYNNFCLDDAIEIKNIEKEINHDVKSIEYFIKNKCLLIKEYDMNDLIPFIHFGLTSNDINSFANALLLKEYITSKYIPSLINIIKNLKEFNKYDELSFPTYTHGQLATPSTFYKEILVFIDRIVNECSYLTKYQFSAKFGGAIGNCNVHYFIYNDIKWVEEFNKFLEEHEIIRQNFTTQIEHYDNISNLFDCLKRINNILIDLCQDMWLYISKDLIQQHVIDKEIGSSTMPHKVNPILFENAEGNLKLANCLLEFISGKLPISRMQRDLTDSTITRNYGSIFGHIIISFNNIQKGLQKINPNIININNELDNYIILAEPVQSYLKSKGIHNSYELLKDYSRGKYYISQNEYKIFIKSLHNLSDKLNDNDINKLLELKPNNYIGHH